MANGAYRPDQVQKARPELAEIPTGQALKPQALKQQGARFKSADRYEPCYLLSPLRKPPPSMVTNKS